MGLESFPPASIEPNSLEALRWGLEHFDGVETDLRITEDDVVVVQHDPYLPDRTWVEAAPHRDFPDLLTFEQLLDDEGVARELDAGKEIWCELKRHRRGKDTDRRLATAVLEILAGRNQDNFRIISFHRQIMAPLKDAGFRCYPILPKMLPIVKNRINKTQGFIRLLFPLGISARRARRQGWSGFLCSHHYLSGWMHRAFHPLSTHERLSRRWGGNNGNSFTMGCDTSSPEEHERFGQLHRVTDWPEAVGPSSPDARLIIHRGVGVRERLRL